MPDSSHAAIVPRPKAIEPSSIEGPGEWTGRYARGDVGGMRNAIPDRVVWNRGYSRRTDRCPHDKKRMTDASLGVWRCMECGAIC
jgi:ribosomal protein L37AE/L43A